MSRNRDEHNVHVSGNMSSEAPTDTPSEQQHDADRSGEDGRIEKIRDILFGVTMREYDRRFSHLEARLQQESDDLREEFRRRCDALEGYIKNEIVSLQTRLTTEQNVRGETMRKVTREVKDLGEVFEQKTGQLAEQVAAGQQGLRQLLLEQSQSLTDDMRRTYMDVSTWLDGQLQEIRRDKTDRSALASLFGEVALRLKNAEPPPGMSVDPAPPSAADRPDHE